LPTTRHHCNLHCMLAQSRGDGHRSLMTPERVLSEYNEDLNFEFFCVYRDCPIERVDDIFQLSKWNCPTEGDFQFESPSVENFKPTAWPWLLIMKVFASFIAIRKFRKFHLRRMF